ncbi:hypothetical protein EVAR_32615_1 [Eumeta japonica]|uniref:Uncharacterized protein n=1 Tax=Eumeta variegata TaxID=151549 RepID=A0A4C1WHM8_EUMVA|nr:hypothetical protein EVAR_32615_1 [Eumeta japonica]
MGQIEWEESHWNSHSPDECNSGSFYFTSVFCESAVFHRSSRLIFVLQPLTFGAVLKSTACQKSEAIIRACGAGGARARRLRGAQKDDLGNGGAACNEPRPRHSASASMR